MCFSSDVSLLTFSIGIIGGILCVTLGKTIDKMVGYFLSFVSLMQGVEFLLWNHQKCDIYNRVLSISGMVLNHLQPIILGIIILIFNKNIKKINKIGVIISMLIYAYFIIPGSIKYLNNPKYQCTIKGDKTNPHLVWKWNEMNNSTIVYVVFFCVMCFLFLIGLPTIKEGIVASLVAYITYSTSANIYPQNSVGALWCFYVAFVPIIYYILRKTVIK